MADDLPTPPTEPPKNAKDPLNLLLAWTDRESSREDGDLFVTELSIEESTSTVEATEGEAEQDWESGTDFQWSEDRANAIDRALQRMGQAPSARVCSLLRDLIDGRQSPDFQQRLSTVESWLHAQVPHWQKTVRKRGGAPTEADDAEETQMVSSFNEALSSASGGIGLALEVVALLRGGDAHQVPLAEALLRQVNDFFQLARHQLLAAEPPPAE